MYTFKSFDTNDLLGNLSKLCPMDGHTDFPFKRPRPVLARQQFQKRFRLKKSEFEFSGVAIRTARCRLYRVRQ